MKKKLFFYFSALAAFDLLAQNKITLDNVQFNYKDGIFSGCSSHIKTDNGVDVLFIEHSLSKKNPLAIFSQIIFIPTNKGVKLSSGQIGFNEGFNKYIFEDEEYGNGVVSAVDFFEASNFIKEAVKGNKQVVINHSWNNKKTVTIGTLSTKRIALEKLVACHNELYK